MERLRRFYEAHRRPVRIAGALLAGLLTCLLYTSDAADD